MTTQHIAKRLSVWYLVVVAILMIPVVTKAPWTGTDFVFAGIVLTILATAYVLITQNMTEVKHRAFVGAGILFIIFLIIGWAATGP